MRPPQDCAPTGQGVEARGRSKKTEQRNPTAPRKDDQGRRFSVVVVKRPGVRVIFSTKLEKHAAELICVRLAAVGCTARVVPMLTVDAPGTQRRR